jgi:hypothetical protein
VLLIDVRAPPRRLEVPDVRLTVLDRDEATDSQIGVDEVAQVIGGDRA